MTDVDPWDFSRPQPTTPPSAPPGLAPAFTDGPVTNTEHNFGSTSFREGDVSTFPAAEVHPPLVWLSGAMVAALVGFAVAAFSLSGPVPYVVAWLIAGPVAIGLLTVFARQDAARQTAVLYTFPSWKPLAYRAVMLLTVLAVIADALRIADWAGHR